MNFSKGKCEYLRIQARERFDKSRATWIECGKWTLPHRAKWLLSQQEGERNNYHIVDPTHVLALRSFSAGFLEGNTSAGRPWFRIGSRNPDINNVEENKIYFDRFTRLALNVLANSNFYQAAGEFYDDLGCFNTGSHYIEEIDDSFGRRLFFHTLTPGSYYCLNDGMGTANVLVREFRLTVKALVEEYGRRKENGSYDWSNFSTRVKNCYENGSYTQTVDVVQIVKQNDDWDPKAAQIGENRQWCSVTYELGGSSGQYYSDVVGFSATETEPDKDSTYLRKMYTRRKPFIIGRSASSSNYEYGEKGPTTDALGLIKSLNKKAIAKDQAIEQMIKPALQGPANLRKSYITTASNSYVPVDAASAAASGQKGLRPIFEINPGFGALVSDVEEIRAQVEKFYYADYLLYLSRNPKTRTATETDAVVEEQRRIIGPNLQSLNWTYNNPILDFLMDYVLDMDPDLGDPPPGLAGQFIRPEFISVFAQAQKAADLPTLERYAAMITNVGQINPKILDKWDVDFWADTVADRLYLPAGINRPKEKVDAQREQAMMMAQRQQALTEVLPAVAGAQKDMASAQQ
jgi:hypothetical protein